MNEVMLQLQSYKLVTAEIIYHLPDYPDILQSYIWQEYDQYPDYPILRRFLNFWDKNLEGKMHSVRVTHSHLIEAREFCLYQNSWNIH